MQRKLLALFWGNSIALPGETPSRAGDGLLDRISGRGDTEGLITTGTPSSASFPNNALMFSLFLSGISRVSLQETTIILKCLDFYLFSVKRVYTKYFNLHCRFGI